MSYPYQIHSLEQYHEAYRKSVENPQAFWLDIASHFHWKKAPDNEVLQWNFKEPKVEWFKNAQLNITENCIDRHLEKNGDKVAFIWEPNNPNEASIQITYNELHQRVSRWLMS